MTQNVAIILHRQFNYITYKEYKLELIYFMHFILANKTHKKNASRYDTIIDSNR